MLGIPNIIPALICLAKKTVAQRTPGILGQVDHRLHDDMNGRHPEAAKPLAELEQIIALPPQMKSRH